MENEVFATHLSAAFNVMGRSIELCAATIERPLAAVMDALWREAVAARPDGARLLLVEDGELESNSNNDVIYWVEPGTQGDLQDPQPPSDGPAAEWDDWLDRNGVPLSKLVTEPVSVALETEPWACAAAVELGKIAAELRERVDRIIEELRRAGGEDEVVVVLRPKAVFTAGPTPFAGELHVRCYCGHGGKVQAGQEEAP